MNGRFVPHCCHPAQSAHPRSTLHRSKVPLRATAAKIAKNILTLVAVARRRLTSDNSGMGTIADHDTYIAAAPESLRPLLAQLRVQLAHTLPDAEEIIAYKMPGFRIGKSIIAGYAAFSKQCGLYVRPGAITALSDDIACAGLKASKTGVTFSPSKPISDGLIKELALASRKDLGL